MSTQHVLQSAVNFPVAMWIDPPAHFAYQGCADETFKIYLYTEDNVSHRVDLYAQGSNSMPWQNPQNKWSHLNPQWRFTDLSGNIINELTLSNNITTTFNGTTGYLASAEFYYIDDMPTHMNCNTILLWAVADFLNYSTQKDITNTTQNVSGFANSKVIAVAPYLINELTPSYFEVTRDGLNPMFDFYWVNAPIPHIVSVIGTTQTGSCTAVMKNVPPLNYLGLSAGPIERTIVDITSSYLTWTPDNNAAYLSAHDYQDFNVGGYLKGKVVSVITADSVNISAFGNVYYENIPIHYPYLWISNPENNTLNRIYAPCIKEEWLTNDLPFLIEFSQNILDTSYLQVTAPTTVMSLTGFHGVYGIAIDETKNIWCADAESDKVYKFDPDGVLLSSINFGEESTLGYGITGGCTPAGIALDGDNNPWITFFDSISVVCLDKDNGNITTIINPGDPYVEPPYVDPAFKPVLAEPDMQNNIWVTYNNTICSVLVKYTSGGSVLGSITLPTCSNPMDLHITQNNDLWVSLTQYAGPPYGESSVNMYLGSSPFTLLSSISALNPGYLAMNSEDSLWFTQSGNTLTRVTTAGIISSWSIGTPVLSTFSSPPNDIFLENALEGLCCDIYDKVYVINSIDNTLYTIINDQVRTALKILPDENLTWYNDGGSIYTEVNENNKSAQAFGDWSGNRWIRKYSTLNTTYVSASLSGISNIFDIHDFNGYNIRRFNESWESVDKIKTFARSPQIADNPVFWDKYMRAVWGDASSNQGEGFGREAYEKIANFTANHTDVNVCNIEQLYNLAQYTDVPIDVYGISFPPELRRIMDIASINQQLLWGSRCKCKKNITNSYATYLSGDVVVPQKYVCEYCGHKHAGNRGDLFNPLTYMVTAYIPFIIEDRSNENRNKYQLITPPPSCCIVSAFDTFGDVCEVQSTSSICITTYPLSSYYNIILPAVNGFESIPTSDGFQQAITYFCFYDYNTTYACTEQIAGVINWNDEYTTLNETASSINEWYGSGQTLEKIINYVLHKGLGLIEE